MDTRLIEIAFPLKQTSLDSVHEKNVRHGHISTLHIWPARRPLAAARAALIATLLPDPGTSEERKKLLEKLGGKVVRKSEGDQIKEETVGGILHWGRESSPDLAWFREEIRKAYGGRAPRVLDPFAGGGAIPLEAMRLGCEVTAIDINPVAWFILKCTLEYPQKLAGQKRPLPAFARQSREFMESYFKAQGYKKEALQAQLARLGLAEGAAPQFAGMEAGNDLPDLDLAWHVRAWGWWVLQRAKADLARFYPTVDGKPTVAYLWARTVTCKHCRANLPLLKTRWLNKKDAKRVVLTMKLNADRTGVVFGVEHLSQEGSNSAPKKAADKDQGKGTMSKAGAACPCCNGIMTMEDIRLEGRAGRLGTVMTAVVVDSDDGKDYRLPTAAEIEGAVEAQAELPSLFADIPFGLPEEPTPGIAGRKRSSSSLRIYGFLQWKTIFTPRQLIAIGSFIKHAHAARKAMLAEGSYSQEWIQALQGYLAMAIDRLADRSSTLCRPDPTPTQSGVINTFSRFALPMTWDFIEGVTIAGSSGGFAGANEWVAKVAEQSKHFLGSPAPKIAQGSATTLSFNAFDVIITDPPYYDAIIYSDLMDFFYIWLRRTLNSLSSEIDAIFRTPLAPKWDQEKNDGELIDDPGRHGWDFAKSRAVYEDGMFRAFQENHRALNNDGRFVIVFAHKQPDAWETLVSAIIRAGFVVDGSWPIQTEMGNRTRALASAALSSSVWLVCKKRAEAARPGWDNRVLEEMREKITTRLRDFWDAGIRGPDFVWAATGPALEAYSQYPVVKKANEPGQVMAVSEFLRHVRRMVVDFVVGRVLTHNGDAEDVSGLDDLTTYYLLHRHDFGLEETPICPCILYAVSCGLSDSALVDRYDLLARTGGQQAAEEEEEVGEGAEAAEAEASEGSGSKVKLKPWHQRKRAGQSPEDTRPIPLIDQTHRLMHLWRAGDVTKVDEYLEMRGLRRNALFHHLLQSLIELAPAGSEERSLLESISNHLTARGVAPAAQSATLWSSEAQSE